MKPLILILLTVTWVQAQTQTIADVARQLRLRQSQQKSVRTITTEDIKKGAPDLPDDPAKPVENPVPAAETKPAEPDPVQQWAQDTLKLREKVRNLMDQETAAQAQVNSITDRIFAPVTTQSDKDQAQTELKAAQDKLSGIRSDLEKTRSELNEKDLKGPPARK